MKGGSATGYSKERTDEPHEKRIPEPVFLAIPLMHSGALRYATVGVIVKITLRALLVALAACLLVSLVLAQSTVPQSYTLTVSSAMALEAMSLNSAVEARVSRFGPREFVDVTGKAQAGQPKAVHVRHWFDLATTKSTRSIWSRTPARG
jgi:diacylglycerol kinase